jgi:hypothetical protein
VLTLLLLTATSAAADAVVGAPFELAVGQSAKVGGVTIGFDEVPSDGRCPIGLYCFWEGDAACNLWAEAGGPERTELVVHTSDFFGRKVTYDGLDILLVALDPYPVYKDPPAPESYVVTLLVTRSTVTPTEPSTWSRIKSMYR